MYIIEESLMLQRCFYDSHAGKSVQTYESPQALSLNISFNFLQAIFCYE